MKVRNGIVVPCFFGGMLAVYPIWPADVGESSARYFPHSLSFEFERNHGRKL